MAHGWVPGAVGSRSALRKAHGWVPVAVVSRDGGLSFVLSGGSSWDLPVLMLSFSLFKVPMTMPRKRRMGDSELPWAHPSSGGGGGGVAFAGV